MYTYILYIYTSIDYSCRYLDTYTYLSIQAASAGRAVPERSSSCTQPQPVLGDKNDLYRKR